MVNKNTAKAKDVEVVPDVDADVDVKERESFSQQFDKDVNNETLKISALLAEFLGTFLLVGAVVKLASISTIGTFFLALILALLILVFGPMSGAHLNPAISLALAINRKISWVKALAYIIMQLLGAAVALLVFHALWEGGLSQSIFNFIDSVYKQQNQPNPVTSVYAVDSFVKSQGSTSMADFAGKVGLGFVSAAVTKGTNWITLFSEVIGTTVFGIGVGHAIYAEDKSMWETGFSVGFGLFAGATIGGSSAIMNPAVAMAIGAFPLKGSEIWQGYVIYALGTCVGMLIGITAYRFIREKAIAK